MLFQEVVGQQRIKDLLIQQVQNGRLPHALLLTGNTGYGTLALALALAQYVLCSKAKETDSCGKCPSCLKNHKIIHPDLHFSFPIIKKSSGTTTSDTYIKEWLEHLSQDKYFDLNDWLQYIDADNKQAIIPDDESDNIIRKLSLAPYEGGWKVMIIWLPERMNQAAANTLLKTLEEPSPKTLFILCSEQPEQLLETILSRTQRIDVPPLGIDDLSEALVSRRGLDENTARRVAHISRGSYLTALKQLCAADDTAPMLASFIELMRLAYKKDLPGLMRWSDEMSSLGRENQKAYLAYMQHMLRENFMYNFMRPELNYMTPKELEFSKNFARFINERNIIRFVEEFAHAQRDVIGNVNPRTIFFNLALQVIILLRA